MNVLLLLYKQRDHILRSSCVANITLKKRLRMYSTEPCATIRTNLKLYILLVHPVEYNYIAIAIERKDFRDFLPLKLMVKFGTQVNLAPVDHWIFIGSGQKIKMMKVNGRRLTMDDRSLVVTIAYMVAKSVLTNEFAWMKRYSFLYGIDT